MLAEEMAGDRVEAVEIERISMMPAGPGPKRVWPTAVEHEVPVGPAGGVIPGMEARIGDRHRLKGHFVTEHAVE